MRAVGGDIAEDGKAEVLGAAVEGGEVEGTRDEWGVEDMAAEEEVVEPRTAKGVGHDLAGIGDAVGISKMSNLFGFAKVLAIGVVEGQETGSSMVFLDVVVLTTTNPSGRVSPW